MPHSFAVSGRAAGALVRRLTASIDWAAIQTFAESTGEAQAATQVRLKTTNEGLQRLRPAELADLLEDLRRDERRELLSALDPDEAADALEEMEPEDLEQLLRETDPADAARLVAAMEPDEAADALRHLPLALRAEVLGTSPSRRRSPCANCSGTKRTRPAES